MPAASFFLTKDMKTGKIYAEESVRSIRIVYGLRFSILPETLDRWDSCDIIYGESFGVGYIREVT